MGIPPTIILEDGDIESQNQDKQIFIERQEANGTHVPIITPSPSQSSRRRGSGNNNSNYSGTGSNNGSFVAKSRKPSRRLSGFLKMEATWNLLLAKKGLLVGKRYGQLE